MSHSCGDTRIPNDHYSRSNSLPVSNDLKFAMLILSRARTIAVVHSMCEGSISIDMWGKAVGVCVFVLLFGVVQCLVEDALVTEKVYLDIEVEGTPPSRVIIGLFGATSPKTVRNFVALANHEVDLSLIISNKYYYDCCVVDCRKDMAIEVPYFIVSLPIL